MFLVEQIVGDLRLPLGPGQHSAASFLATPSKSLPHSNRPTGRFYRATANKGNTVTGCRTPFLIWHGRPRFRTLTAPCRFPLRYRSGKIGLQYVSGELYAHHSRQIVATKREEIARAKSGNAGGALRERLADAPPVRRFPGRAARPGRPSG